MTSETEALKTNEFLRRRKLRIQQVREQSKEIAKKIRQRAKVENLRHLGDLDAKKEKEYFQHQEKLVKRLEHLYAESLRNVGTSHKNATEVEQEDVPLKTDLSKKRGKEAAAELRRMKQEKLDKQKKLLDRKLQARETANEISRDKSSAVANKLLGKPSTSKITDLADAGNNEDKVDKPEIVTSDMATQWDFEELPNEWEPHVPELSLPKDDKDSLKESVRIGDSRVEKNKRLNLFALSDEMPSSLRGGLASVPEENHLPKPSLTLVSEYLQNRGLRLRESDVIVSSKKQADDLQSLKQTILRTRSAKAEGSAFQNVCHVADVQVVPVPSWQAENSCGFCPHHVVQQKHPVKSREFKTVTNSQINKIFSSIRPLQHDMPSPSPVLRGSSPFRRNKLFHRSFSAKGTNEEKSRHNEPDSAISKKNYITTYNHSTRDTKDVPSGDKLVIRDPQTDDDAYSLAVKESSSNNTREQEHQKKLQDMRNKIAMTKQNVEKEYKDTMAFLNSLPKDKSKPIKNAYKNEQRQQMQKENHQRKMQQEFKKIEKECRRHVHSNPKPNNTTGKDMRPHKSKSPADLGSDDDFNVRDFQYSWMPVPESDGSLAIHTIPTTLKEPKPGNSVKFSKVDSYHEYRSRHKHTPPTKDTTGSDKNTNKRVEAVMVGDNVNESTDCSSLASDTSSVENLHLDNHERRDKDKKLTDADRIIIYKILDSKLEKRDRDKKNSKLLKEIAKSLSSLDKERNMKPLSPNEDIIDKVNKQKSQSVKRSAPAETRVSFEQLNEGVYKTVNEKGDNITTMYFSDSPREGENVMNDEIGPTRQCSCGKNHYKDREPGAEVNWESGDDPATLRSTPAELKSSNSKKIETSKSMKPSEVSMSSYKTATNDKTNILTDAGFVKLLEEGSQETGKFYIGATGFLKDDDYEVIIQLRKKDGAKEERKEIKKQSEYNQTPTSVKSTWSKEQTPDLRPVSEAAEVQNYTDKNVDNPENIQTNNILPIGQETATANVISQNQTNVDNREQIVPSSVSSGNVMSDEALRQISKVDDKNVFIPFQLSNTMPSTSNKSEPIPPPDTTINAQTTPDAPDQRPVFLHLSSSTSTAYMSPPELILPKFLKHDYKITYDEMYDLTKNSILQDSTIEFVDQETVCCEEYADCRCKKCTHAKKIVVSRIKPSITSRLRQRTPRENNIKTPPNTAINSTTDKVCEKHNARDSKKEVKNFNSKTSSTRCKKHNKSKNCHKNHMPNYRRNMPTNKRSSRNFVLRVNSNAATAYKLNRNSLSNDKRNSKSRLNPVVKSYVDKLLRLNRQSLRAIEVMNQECSSVTTPGSSIVDVGLNINKSKPVENKISLEQMKDMLLRQILENAEKNQNNDGLNNNDVEKYRKKPSCPRIPRKKLHKVKSLNISKHILKNKPEASQDLSNGINCVKVVSSSSSVKADNSDYRKLISPRPSHMSCHRTKSRSKSSPSPRNIESVFNSKTTISNIASSKIYDNTVKKSKPKINLQPGSEHTDYRRNLEKPQVPTCSLSNSSTSGESESGRFYITRDKSDEPLNISTQTGRMIDSDINFMKLAENKLQNMEKIADLTEKCTKRLSNLAKVLEEVRKNKSMAYSQISDSASDSDRRSDKSDKLITRYKPPTPSYNMLFDLKSGKSETEENNSEAKPPTPNNDLLLEIKNLTGTIAPRNSEKTILQSKSPTPSGEPLTGAMVHRSLEKNVLQSTLPTPSDEPLTGTIYPRDSEKNISKSKSPTMPFADELYDVENIRRSDNEVRQKKSPTNDPDFNIKNVILENSDKDMSKQKSPTSLYKQVFDTNLETITPPSSQLIRNIENVSIIPTDSYVPILTDIPKPNAKNPQLDVQRIAEKYNDQQPNKNNQTSKHKGKPPPALSRINLKDVQDFIIPHELSTVMEVDSPMSIRAKNLSGQAKFEQTSNSCSSSNKEIRKKERHIHADKLINPDLLLSDIKLSRGHKTSSTDSSDDSKMQMMDLKQFNDIMLKPFISIQEYAKQCNIEVLDEGSNIDDVLRDGAVNDDLSSLHSDGSLPDVIAELLKRNIISEPFKFDTTSNVNSTSMSSESTLSVLALSKVRKETKKTSVCFKNKENIAETSDTLSVSSNPDLENAFKKLGMGWASSTLKKTKERLALSSSSNTSSSSMSQFKLKSFKNPDVPVIVSDSVSSALNVSKKPLKEKIETDNSKNVEQQTSQRNSMTVKEFLTNELAKKITFTNKSRDETEDYVSLYETKMPEEMRHSSQMAREERSVDNGPNGSVNRARTSTPVQLFKSMTYHSSSSSNMSNGLFSNADDLSSVKGTSNSMRNHSTSDKDDLTIPNYSLRMRKDNASDCSKSD